MKKFLFVLLLCVSTSAMAQNGAPGSTGAPGGGAPGASASSSGASDDGGLGDSLGGGSDGQPGPGPGQGPGEGQGLGGAGNPEKFAEVKAAILKRIDEHRQCVQAASDREALKACMPQRGQMGQGGGMRGGFMARRQQQQ